MYGTDEKDQSRFLPTPFKTTLERGPPRMRNKHKGRGQLEPILLVASAPHVQTPDEERLTAAAFK